MIRRILVPTDGSAPADIGVRYAVVLAQRHGASLHGLHVVDIKLLEGPFLRDISASLGTAPYLNYQGNIAMILEERGKAALEAFGFACREAEVSCETSLETGIVTRCILEKAELADLIVMGRGGEHTEWLDGLVGSTTEAVVRRARQPVLITGTDTPGTQRFVVAYDGSVHAKRALHMAAEISADWHMPFHVLVVGEKRGEALVAEARSYLASHSVPVEYVVKSGDPSEVIVIYAAECEADLLVMGAYGHTKVRELVVGSTTAYAINHAPCPLLLIRSA
ncbi:MAG TPA: universal stress protein [Candidatus Hydrogenedentes bacterium]|nr:universal stress protein [Candidatus Hydrogenedentota bacterium]HPG66713.1 universal stress protein [Candidatus Hydrogenedentota bacterium]